MPLYEHVFIARRDISSQQVDNLTESLTTIIKDGGGNVTKTEYWGLRNLAYRIKKNRKGHYVLMNIDSPYPAVAEMGRIMGLNEDIIRTMTIRVDELEEGPSVVMQQKTSRDDRGGRRDAPPRRDSREEGVTNITPGTTEVKSSEPEKTPEKAEDQATEAKVDE